MPVGSHIGQLNTSFIKMDLPAQFLMRYTYDFLLSNEMYTCSFAQKFKYWENG